MSTAQEFLQSFFREKAAIYAEANVHLAPILNNYFGAPLSDRIQEFLLPATPREIIEQVEENGNSALITTCIDFTKYPLAKIREQYVLEACEGIWKIVQKNSECYLCRINGKSPKCPRCQGMGWYNTSKPVAE